MTMQHDPRYELLHAEGSATPIKGWVRGVPLEQQAHAQLRNIADAYAGVDGHKRFVADFAKVWDKVMMLDRYDVRS